MTKREDLFHEDVYDALRGIVDRAGGMKVVGTRLWPHFDPATAGRRLSDCLNRERDEKLDPEQFLLLLRIGHEAGYHGAKHWIDNATGYAPSTPVEPEDAIASLIRETRAAFENANKAAAAFERAVGTFEKRRAKA